MSVVDTFDLLRNELWEKFVTYHLSDSIPMGGTTSKFDANDWIKADGKLQDEDQTIDGSLPTAKYQTYNVIKRGVNQRDFDVTDSESKLLYTTRAVPGTIACFDVIGGEKGDFRLRITVDIARRYWIVHRYDVPSFPQQVPDLEQTQKLALERAEQVKTVADNDERPSMHTPVLYKKACLVVSWSRYMIVSTFFDAPSQRVLFAYKNAMLEANRRGGPIAAPPMKTAPRARTVREDSADIDQVETSISFDGEVDVQITCGTSKRISGTEATQESNAIKSNEEDKVSKDDEMNGSKIESSGETTDDEKLSNTFLGKDLFKHRVSPLGSFPSPLLVPVASVPDRADSKAELEEIEASISDNDEQQIAVHVARKLPSPKDTKNTASVVHHSKSLPDFKSKKDAEGDGDTFLHGSVSTNSVPDLLMNSGTQVARWVQQQSQCIHEHSMSILASANPLTQADMSDPREGVLSLSKPLLLCQEIFNKLFGTHQTSLISKEKVVELLQADRKYHLNDSPDKNSKACKDLDSVKSLFRDSRDYDEQLVSENAKGTSGDPGCGVSEHKETDSVDESSDELDKDTGEDDMNKQPLVGFWTWEHTLRSQNKIKLHLAKGSDLALHVVMAIIANQVRFERHAIAMTL